MGLQGDPRGQARSEGSISLPLLRDCVDSYCVALHTCPQDCECRSQHQGQLSLLEPLSFHLINNKAESQGTSDLSRASSLLRAVQEVLGQAPRISPSSCGAKSLGVISSAA